ncbi:hypothetical protein FRX31_033374 [Thalictrum thalictroides]|uniref:Uncharacterized protein n=1 Tax=Thalictrum thalictroides TaxID=46969 RepID=A0A7J6UWU7_THATH|nr:hypothetical protein FRX31_033374 [Thalictrum thalictroides]
MTSWELICQQFGVSFLRPDQSLQNKLWLTEVIEQWYKFLLLKEIIKWDTNAPHASHWGKDQNS